MDCSAFGAWLTSAFLDLARDSASSRFPLFHESAPSSEKYNRVIGPFIPRTVDENKPRRRRVGCMLVEYGVTETANSIPIGRYGGEGSCGGEISPLRGLPVPQARGRQLYEGPKMNVKGKHESIQTFCPSRRGGGKKGGNFISPWDQVSPQGIR